MGSQLARQHSLHLDSNGSDTSSDSIDYDYDEECENEGGPAERRSNVDPQSPYTKSVCHLTECCLPGTLRPDQYHGTGFFGYFDLPSQGAKEPNLTMYGLFTANHVLNTEFLEFVLYANQSREYPIKTKFDFIKEGEGQEFRLIPKGFIFACPVLDLTFIQILDEERNMLIDTYGRKFLPLEQNVNLDWQSELTIVQHPNAEHMKIASNKGAKKHGLNITHSISTSHGSSGSPVFLTGTEIVIGVHRGQSREYHHNVAICTDWVIAGIGKAYQTRGKNRMVGPPDNSQVPRELTLRFEFRERGKILFRVYCINFKDGSIGYCTPTSYGWYWTFDDPGGGRKKRTRRFDILWLPMVNLDNLADRDRELLRGYIQPTTGSQQL